MKMLMERSKRAHGGNPWTPLKMNGVISSRHLSAEVMAETLVQIESGRSFPEVRKAIQSKQFLECLEKGSKFLKIQSLQKCKMNICGVDV